MAPRFDASADRLERTTDLPTITSFTYMAWIYISVDRNAYSCFLSYGSDDSGAYYYIGTRGDGITLITWNGNSEEIGTGLSVGTWVHICMTVAGTGVGDFLGYLNGALDITSDGRAANPSETLQIANDRSNEFLNGRAFAVKCWSGAALTADEIRREMWSIVPQRYANLYEWWPLFPGSAERLRGYSGNGRDWIEGGTLVDEDSAPVPWGIPAPTYMEEAAAVGLIMSYPSIKHPQRNFMLRR